MQESTWSNTTKLVVLMLLLIIGGWALVRFSAAIPSLIVSALLAFLLSSPTSAVVRHTGLPRGVAVLLVSSELDEIMSLSDRIAVMYKGEIIDIVPREEATRENIGLLMAGVKRDERV